MLRRLIVFLLLTIQKGRPPQQLHGHVEFER
jgi:hypothetical protein